MARLAVCRDFLPDFARLERSVQAKVYDLFPKFEQATFAGVHLEKMAGSRDPRARTVRVDRFWRGVVLAPERGDTYLLLRVLPHDAAADWCARNTFTVNQVTGAIEILDVEQLTAVASAVSDSAPPTERALLDDRSDRDLTKLGLPEDLLPLLRRITTQDELLALSTVLPPGQGDALLMLADGLAVEEIWAQLVADEHPGAIDPTDFDAALDRPATRAQFRAVTDVDELHEILGHPFDQWPIFLHPQQRRLAYRSYKGSARVSGGAGTGKTVVALHRARALAEQLGPPDRAAPEGGRILFTTFTRNLTRAIESHLRLLGGPDLLARVEVINADRLALRLVRDEEGAPPRVLADESAVWQDIVDESGCRFGTSFLQQEWRQIILAQALTSRDAYLAARRPGRGVRLSRRDRAEVWKLTEAFTHRLTERGERTFLQLAADAAGYLTKRSVRPYAHVIVDEAQDLHPAQWRMLRAATPEGPDDLFIVGDTHQRIYDHRVSLSALGIEVRGRSHNLRLNYRTTHEILAWALGLLTGERFDDLDDGTDTLAGYRSLLRGSRPTVVGYADRPAELRGLADAVRQWTEAGVEPGEIGVAARTSDALEAARTVLRAAGIPARVMTGDDDGATGDEVAVATMHRMKGLEYRCVAVIDAGRGRVPSPVVVPEADDPIEHRHGLQRERCLLYVACTRARDDLRVSWSGAPSPFVEALIR
jgi:hypothetical protein